MDELQTEAEAPESLETESELAPDTGENLEQKPTESAPEENKDPAGFTKAIHRKHHELMEERRKNASLEQRLATVEAAQQPIRPNVPDAPDPYDDNFEQRLAERDAAVQAAATFDAQQQAQQAQRQQQAAQTLQTQQQVGLQKEQAFSERAKAGGISDADISTSIQTIAAYGGLGNELADFVLGNDQGPAITAHLAKNPGKILEIQGMSPMQGAVYLSSMVPASVAPKTTGAPAPADSLGGGGTPPAGDGPPGATYE